MPNQWETATNSNNQFDASGYFYANAIDTPIGNYLEKFYPRSGFLMSSFWETFPYESLDSMRYDYSNYYREAIYLPIVPLSTQAKDKIVQLINILVDSLSITNFQTIKQSIINWENEVQAISSQFSDEELAKLLSVSSIARYGTYIWLKREICCAGSGFENARGGGFWNWVGAVVGAIVAIVATSILWGPLTVAGFIFFGLIGAVGGYYIVDEFFSNE